MKHLYTAPLCLTFHPFAAPPFEWNHIHNTAPNLPMSKLYFIRDMIQSQSLATSQMAEAAECSEKKIKNTRRNLRLFGQVHAPSTRIGRRRSITPPM